MATGWSADEQANLLRAWEATNQEEGTLEDLYGHFVRLCGNDHSQKSKSVVLQRKQTLAYVCKVIATYASLKSEKPRNNRSSTGSGVASSEAASNGASNDPARRHPWFRLTSAGRSDKFAALKTKQYTYVDLDYDTFREVERLKAGVKVVKMTSPIEWIRDELLALVRALGDALDEPPRSRQRNESTAIFRRFVSRCGGETKRTSQSAVSKLDTVMNMVMIISEFNKARKKSCSACFDSSNWYALTPAERKARFGELNASSHRYVEVEEELYQEAALVLRKRKSGEASGNEDQPPLPATESGRSSVAVPPPTAAVTASTSADSEEKEREPISADTPSAGQRTEARETGTSSMATTSLSNSDGNDPENGALVGVDHRDDSFQDREASSPVIAWKTALEKDVADVKSALEQAHMRFETVEQRVVEMRGSDKKRKRDDEQTILNLKTTLDEQRRSDHQYFEAATKKIQELQAENALVTKKLQDEQADQRQTLLRMKERLRSDDKERSALVAQLQRLQEERRTDQRAQIKLLKERLDDERDGESRESGRRSQY